ncbi:MAG TPA: helicase [Streptosporangiaceae bacterium]
MSHEQEYITMLYGHLDELRERAAGRLTSTLRESGGTPQARTERDVSAVMFTNRIAQLDAAENGLCFGRLDFDDSGRRYIGRMGIRDEAADYEPLLLDWRAPAARPFYLATAASPEGVKRRRHIKTRRRQVLGIDDEVLDLTAPQGTQHQGLTGEAALLAALSASRTGRMADIVETIQVEQDRIIRAPQQGVVVVQGGPGTGKTAVALHRAAFLLYTHRRQLEKRGVLIVGPNATFLRYIGQVLPALGETGVVLSTVGELYPGVVPQAEELPEVAAIKGRLAMAQVIAAAVRDRQQVPKQVTEIRYQREVLRLDREMCVRARERARRSRRPHNQARAIFVREIIDALVRQVTGKLRDSIRETDAMVAEILGEGGPPDRDLLDEVAVDEIRRELRADPEVRAAINRLWPAVTPQRLLADLFSSAARLRRAAPRFTEAERSALLRDSTFSAGKTPYGTLPAGKTPYGTLPAGKTPYGSDWTLADVPLLDEAAELLGEDDRAQRAREERKRREQVAYAGGVVDLLSQDRLEPEVLLASDLIDAHRLAERHAEEEYLTTAERAAADRTWAFGHVIVDEAQELSEMGWRMLMRRCPTRSMTLVGDVAQTGDPAGTSSWQRVLEPYMGKRWRLERLTVNYRTPAEIMTVAADVAAGIDPPPLEADLPQSVRESGVPPWRLAVPADELAGQLAKVVADEAAAVGDGRLAVIVPVGRVAELGDVVKAAVSGVSVGADADLENPVVVIGVPQVKGLEFDSVLIADPAGILAESARGHSDLYVAMTRATQRLGVLHTGEPPRSLSRLQPREAQ